MEDLSSISVDELVRRCSASDGTELWQEFVRRFHRFIAVVAMRTAARLGDSSRQTVDDLIQETYLKLCADNFRILRTFEQRHPDAFIAYVKVVTANVVRDHFKASRSQRRGAHQVEGLTDDFVPAAAETSRGSPKAMERAILLEEVNRHLEECVVGPDRDRNRKIFWLYYRAGLSARAISELSGQGLSIKGVETIISRITKQLRDRMSQSSRASRHEEGKATEGVLPAESF
jgi:RNA polymerase sigma-70 factor (ECF subfamily)